MFIVDLETAVSCYKQTLLPRHANSIPYAEVDNLTCIELEHATLERDPHVCYCNLLFIVGLIRK